MRAFLSPKFYFCGFLAAVGLFARAPRAKSAQPPRFDHVFVIILENHGFDDAIYNGPSPFLQKLAQEQGLATLYFGVAHPSLPNYLALIGGDEFGIRDDRPSCFAVDIAPPTACNKIAGDSLVEQLHSAGLSFAIYAAVPAGGRLAGCWSAPAGAAARFMRRSTIPFAYFETLARDTAALATMKPYEALAGRSRWRGAECGADRAQPVP